MSGVDWLGAASVLQWDWATMMPEGGANARSEVLVRLLALIQKRGLLTLGQTLDAVRSARGVSI
mgnify:CR=1 FL=1